MHIIKDIVIKLSEKDLKDIVSDYLRKEGYPVESDDVTFSHQTRLEGYGISERYVSYFGGAEIKYKEKINNETNKSLMNVTLLNEDGTPFNPPINPLEEKWKKLYPSTPMAERHQYCDGYSCAWCDRCPKGDNWVIPEDDREEFLAYISTYNTYIAKHNPNFKM